MKRLLPLVLLILLSDFCVCAQKKTNIFSPTRKQLLAERDSLKIQVDELRGLLQVLRDSLAYESDETMQGSPYDQISIYDSDDSELLLSADSLLTEWYVQQRTDIPLVEMEPEGIDTLTIAPEITDQLLIDRLYRMNSFINVPYNKIVRNHILNYATKMPQTIGRIIGLSLYYMPIFEEIFDKYNMPYELKALAVIESALNPKAVSRAGAKGMWQFMYQTSKGYGLTVNSFVDERYDPYKSAHAAAKYLMDAYNVFGDWSLAIASYNCGGGNVTKAIRRAGGVAAVKDFWDIYPYLPKETRGYLPAFVAAEYILTYYKEHGIVPQPVSFPTHVDTLKVNKMLHFEQVAHYTGATVEQLASLNPQYVHNIVPGNEREYVLCLPYGAIGEFLEHEKEIYSYRDSVYFSAAALKKIKQASDGVSLVHKVSSGEVLGRIASKYGVKVSDIMRWNKLKTSTIHVGQKLIIYPKGGGPAASSKSSSGSSSSSAGKSGSKSSSTETVMPATYTVKSGDSLWSIANRYKNFGLTVEKLKKLNGFKDTPVLKLGQKIRLR